MELDKFIKEFFGNITDAEGIRKIKECVQENMYDFIKYDTAKVEFQVLTENDNRDCTVDITSEEYDDGEVIFIDCHIEGQM